MVIIEKLKKIIRWFSFKFRQFKQQKRKKPNIVTDGTVPLKHLGTTYGGWKVPEGLLNEHSICYFAGAGIDISFDVEVVKTYGSRVFIIDPTPQAKSHFNELKEKTQRGEKLEIDRKRGQYYDAEPWIFERIQWLDVGLWGENKTIKFYEPSDTSTIVSHSIVNLHGTKTYFEAEVVRLSSLMKKLGHKYLDYLKIDIEGAEYEVIDSLIMDQVQVGVLGIEFDEVHHPLDQNSNGRIEAYIGKLKAAGFLVVDVDANYNVTLIHQGINAENRIT